MTKYGNRPNQAQLLQEIDEASFAVIDIHLYLDTHPEDEEALAFYQEHMAHRLRLMRTYAQNFGPLTIDDAIESDGDTWKWSQQPFPWEQEGACR
jgi:spore coat protein JB